MALPGGLQGAIEATGSPCAPHAVTSAQQPGYKDVYPHNDCWGFAGCSFKCRDGRCTGTIILAAQFKLKHAHKDKEEQMLQQYACFEGALWWDIKKRPAVLHSQKTHVACLVFSTAHAKKKTLHYLDPLCCYHFTRNLSRILTIWASCVSKKNVVFWISSLDCISGRLLEDRIWVYRWQRFLHFSN